MRIAPLVAVVAIIICGHGALAETRIEAGIDEEFSVQCYAFANGTVVQKDYGLWNMQLHLLKTLQLAVVDSDTSDIRCHFVWSSASIGSTMHQWFEVYVNTGLVFDCGDICQWTVFEDGFYLLNPASGVNTLVYQWLTGEDNWTAPI